MTVVALDEAQSRLAELVDRLAPGEEFVLVRDGHAVARLVPADGSATRHPPGFLKGTVLHVAPDFDAPLEDFREHRE